MILSRYYKQLFINEYKINDWNKSSTRFEIY